jgi:hypothetical protein
MSTASGRVRAFFERYERGSNALDLDVIAGEYADAFMFADPGGARVVGKQQLLAALPKRQELFKARGHKSTKIVSLDETALDDRHVMVRVHFSMLFESRAAGPVDVALHSTFILRFDGDAARIILQLEHQDAQQAMRERGVLPAGPA